MNQRAVPITLSGIGSSPGVVIGRAVVFDEGKIDIKPTPIKATAVEKEIARFRQAIARVKKDLLALAANVGERLGHDYARIFEAQAMIADDTVINSKVIEEIRSRKLNAAYLYHRQIGQIIDQLAKSDNSYLRERILDINSVHYRLINNLLGIKRTVLSQVTGPIVVVAKYLNPGDLLGFSVRRHVGLALGLGGVTSHTSVLAKSLQLPAVVGLGPEIEKITDGDLLILDGFLGRIFVNPDKGTISWYRRRRQQIRELEKLLKAVREHPAITTDRHRLRIFNNMELPSETNRILSSGAEGIGLFRTEYLFLTESALPSSERQFRIYRQILDKMAGRPVTVRTYDLGGDKFVGTTVKAVDPNPFLGWRAIRFCLDRPDIFKAQLKALLRASMYGHLEIMLPMISSLEELLKAKQIIQECRQELIEEKIRTKDKIPIGIMIEVPSAVLVADHLAREVDFFSLGTNDLIQYTLAVDRTNEMLAHLYQSYHPAVLQLIAQTIAAGHRHKIRVAICGEMGADPLGIILLVGLGVDEISVSAQSTGLVKHIVRGIDYRRAKEVAAACLKKATAAEVEEFLMQKVKTNWPKLLPLVELVKGTNGAASRYRQA